MKATLAFNGLNQFLKGNMKRLPMESKMSLKSEMKKRKEIHFEN